MKRIAWLLMGSLFVSSGVPEWPSRLAQAALDALRYVKYDLLMRTPLIAGIPREKVSCDALARSDPMVVVAFGQSNSANYGRGRHTPENNAFSFYEGHCYRMTDPVPGADGDGGSVWSRFATRRAEAGETSPLVMATIGVGGSSIHRWAPGGDLFARLVQTLQALETANLRPTHLFWHQGETDAGQNMTTETYRRALQRMIDDIRAMGIRAPVYVAVATFCYGTDSVEVRAAQRNVVDPTQGILPGPDTDQLRGPKYRRDDCHFTSAGMVRAADAWWTAVSRAP